MARQAQKAVSRPKILCTIFKNEVGETINNYMTRVRIEKAMKLIHFAYKQAILRPSVIKAEC
jgi:YesN/AraC family two-component response regulator